MNLELLWTMPYVTSLWASNVIKPFKLLSVQTLMFQKQHDIASARKCLTLLLVSWVNRKLNQSTRLGFPLDQEISPFNGEIQVGLTAQEVTLDLIAICATNFV